MSDPVTTQIIHGDCLSSLSKFRNDTFDLIVTSPPYADQRKNTYGGIKPDQYVKWFLERSASFARGLKPTGTFILNIKEKAESGERHVYVLQLILALREQGWLWTNPSGTSATATQVNGLIVSGTPGSDACSLTRRAISKCSKKT